MELRQIKAIEQANKQKLINAFPLLNLNENSGIYIFTREENGIKYAYIGQAKHLLSRLAQHLSGYSHIDLSLKKRGLHSINNLNGWSLNIINCFEDELNDKEQIWIKRFADNGYQLYNKTVGGQLQGKNDLGDREVRGYRSGVAIGYAKASKGIAKLFKSNLKVEINGKSNKNKEKALAKFKIFIGE